MIKANFNKLRNDEGVMWGSIDLMDGLLEEMAEHHKERYWKVLRDTHELMYGKHFDKEYAEWEVEQMHHKSPDGKVYKGEHWTMEQTSEACRSIVVRYLRRLHHVTSTLRSTHNGTTTFAGQRSISPMRQMPRTP